MTLEGQQEDRGEIYEAFAAVKEYLMGQFEDLSLSIRAAYRDERLVEDEEADNRETETTRYPEGVLSVVDWDFDFERRTGDPRQVIDSTDMGTYTAELKDKPLPITVTMQLETACRKQFFHLCIGKKVQWILNKERKDAITTASGHSFFLRPSFTPAEAGIYTDEDALWTAHYRFDVPIWLHDEADAVEANLLKEFVLISQGHEHHKDLTD